MSSASNVIDLVQYRSSAQREIIDDISARAFLFLRDEAAAEGVAIQSVIAEHLLGIALVVEAVEGSAAAKGLLTAVAEKLGRA
jgi:hypothetical protein